VIGLTAEAVVSKSQRYHRRSFAVGCGAVRVTKSHLHWLNTTGFISFLRIYMGSHSVTVTDFHPTQVNTARFNPSQSPVLDLPIPEE